jgi:hypothetical protein
MYTRNQYQINDGSTLVVSRVPVLRCRQIGETNISAIAALLGPGFFERNREILSISRG